MSATLMGYFDSLKNSLDTLSGQAEEGTEQTLSSDAKESQTKSSTGDLGQNMPQSQDSYSSKAQSLSISDYFKMAVAVKLAPFAFAVGCDTPSKSETCALSNISKDKDGDGFSNLYDGITDEPCYNDLSDKDCNDNDAAINDNASEVCDGLDNDCDNQIDDDDSDVTGQPIWYRSPEDADGDGYNSKDIDHDPTDTRNQLVSCNQPDGFQAEPVTGDDCKDSDPLFYPGAVETCDGEDNDCDTLVDEDLPTKTYYLDADSDGYGDTSNATENCDLDNSPLFTQTPGDCADNDAKINPLATEVCDSKDNNCDGSIDEKVTTKLYADTDGDGYGDKNSSIEGCSVSGYVTDNSDCDDTDININPAATEVCDGIDNNCNLYVDAQDANNPSEPVGVDMKTWYIDGDADTYGVDTLIQVACSQADAESTWGGSFAFASQNGDCNDNEVSVNPSASELCDGVDNNCNGIIDDGATGGATSTFYADKDGDNYGNAADTITACATPAGYVTDNTDCDDSNANLYPGSVSVWYNDADVDGYGDAANSKVILGCDSTAGFSSNATDCDDTNPSVNPAATEVCDANNIDENCNGKADDADTLATGQSAWYADSDTDSYGDSSVVRVACDEPTGFVGNATDCDDTDNAIYPGAAELCTDAIDMNCDGSAPRTDADYDGFASCEECDDSDASINPKASESCNSLDDNCDGQIDDGLAFNTYYSDADTDGYGDSSTAVSDCKTPTSSYSTVNGDCNDNNNAVYPGAPDYCNLVDDDCNGAVDDNPSVYGSTYYADSDSDTYGNASQSQKACSQPSGYVVNSTDCNDTKAAINPGAQEICDASNTDEDCDGLADDSDSSATGTSNWYGDADSDSFGNLANLKVTCDQPVGYVNNSTDCNDSNASINPSSKEICDTLNTDEDCDSLADDADSSVSVSSKFTWYQDADTDNYGNASVSKTTCDQPAGYIVNNTDCDDTNSSINPAATEVCDANNADEDCDKLVNDADPSVTGTTSWYTDADGDQYGDKTKVVKQACLQPSGFINNSNDCDDANSKINPAAQEVCDSGSVDENCNGFADDADSTVLSSTKSTWYADTDGDTYGNPSSSKTVCDQPVSFITNNTDCDDTRSQVNPAATEIYNDGLDNNCDSQLYSATGTLYSDAKYGFGSAAQIYGTEVSSYFGSSTAIGSDAASNLMYVGAYGTDFGTTLDCGALYAFDGTTQNYAEPSNSLAAFYGNISKADFGYSVTNLGDLNSDGYGDVAVGAPSRLAGTPGYAEVIFGPLSTSAAPATLLTGEANSDRAGWAVGEAQINGASYVLVSSVYSDTGGLNSGSVYGVDASKVVGTSLALSTASFKITGKTISGQAGYSLASGDLNGDGSDEVIVGAPFDGASKAGVVYVCDKPSGTISVSSCMYAVTGASNNNNFGTSTVSGDYDNDGYDDLATGAVGVSNGASNSGAVYLLSGAAVANGSIDSNASRIRIDGTNANSKLGYTLTQADFDQDGYDDFASGAPAVSTSQTGYAFLIPGGLVAAGGTYQVPDGSLDHFVTLEGEQPGDYAGFALGAGDADMDSVPDLFVGAPLYTAGLSTNSGAAYLINGNGGSY